MPVTVDAKGTSSEWAGHRKVPTPLHSLPASDERSRESYPLAINEHGQIVGASQTRSGHMHAFLWQNGKMTDLSPVGELESYATALNERGQIVGSIRAGERTSAVRCRLTRG